MTKRILSPLLMSFLVFFLLTGGLHLNAVEKHVVTTQGLREAVVTSSAARSANIKAIEDQLTQWGFSATQVKTAVRTLNNSELEYLTHYVNKSFYGGADSGRTMGLIVMGAVAAFILYWELATLSAGVEPWT